LHQSANAARTAAAIHQTRDCDKDATPDEHSWSGQANTKIQAEHAPEQRLVVLEKVVQRTLAAAHEPYRVSMFRLIPSMAILEEKKQDPGATY